ncbi:MAG: hypothetical protein H0X24_23590 [Ktedonobacterales bacterium]|nr:hypothetical protein [Ktedonobacterales bacterium]
MSTDPYYGDVPPYLPDGPTTPALAPVAVATVGAPPLAAPNRRRLFLIGGIALVVLALIGSLAFVAVRAATPSDAQSVAQNYCAAAKAQNYPKAYTYFAPGLQGALDAVAYPAGAGAVDAISGKLTACKLGKLHVTPDGKAATLSVSVTRQKVGSQAFVWQFAQVKTGTWQFTAAPDAAVVSLTLATLYCTDVHANKLTEAFNLLTAAAQQSAGDAAQFTQDMQQTSKVVGGLQRCQLQKLIPSKDGKTNAIKLGIWFGNVQNVPAEIDVQPQADGTAKISSVNVYVANNPLPYPPPVTLLQQILQLLGTLTGTGA